MLTLLTLTAPSLAASLCSVGASPEASTPACGCVRLATTSAGRAGTFWLGGVPLTLSTTFTPASSSCFDYGAALATVPAGPSRAKVATLLEYAGLAVAASGSRSGSAVGSTYTLVWSWDPVPGASTLMSDVLEGDSDELPPWAFPRLPGLWELRNPFTGATEATVQSARPLSGAFWADLDGDQLDDLVIGFADGSLFEVTGGFDPYVPLVLQ
jgi:hypothetical protein